MYVYILWVADPHGGQSRVMSGVSQCCILGFNLMLGVLASMYAIPRGWTLCRSWISRTIFMRVCTYGRMRGCVGLVAGTSGKLAISMPFPPRKLVRILFVL